MYYTGLLVSSCVQSERLQKGLTWTSRQLVCAEREKPRQTKLALRASERLLPRE
jgi:hypothetical protein